LIANKIQGGDIVVFFNERALLPTLAIALSIGALFSGEDARAQAPKPEKPNFTLAIGGVSTQIYFLPVVLADRLGYFEEAGLKVNMINTGSGTKGLQAVVSGGADMTAGSFEHVIQLRGVGKISEPSLNSASITAMCLASLVIAPRTTNRRQT